MTNNNLDNPARGLRSRGVSLFLFMATLIVLTVLLSGGLYYYLSAKREQAVYRARIDNRIESLAHSTRARVSSAVITGDDARAEMLMNHSLGFNAHVRQVWIVMKEDSTVFFDLTGRHTGEAFKESMKPQDLQYFEADILPVGGVGVAVPRQSPVARLIIGYRYYDAIESQQLNLVIDYAKTIHDDMHEMLHTGQIDQARIVLANMLLNDVKTRRVRMIDNQGTVLMDLGKDNNNELVLGKEGAPIAEDDHSFDPSFESKKPLNINRVTSDTGDHYYVVNIAFHNDDKRLGFIQFEYLINEFVHTQEKQKQVSAIIIATFIVCGIFGGLVTSLWLAAPIRKLSQAAKRAAAGDLDQTVDPRFTGKEINELAESFNDLLRQRRDAELSIRESEQQLRKLAQKIIKTQEQERTRLAHEIHDEIGHRMTATSFIVESMKKRLGADDSDLGAIKDHLDNLFDDLMRIYKGLSPIVIEKLGLTTAINGYINETAQQMDVSINAELDDVSSRELSHEDAVNIYRIFQEAMTNVYRHSKASNVNVKLTKTDREITLEVSDDGIGLAMRNGKSTSLGIAGMRERTYTMSGDFSIESHSGGTVVNIRIPFNAPATERQS